MNPRSRMTAAVVLVLALTGAGLSHAWKPSVYLADQMARTNLEQLFPKAFGDWRLDDQLPIQLISPDLQAKIDAIYSQTLSRTYRNSEGARVMLSVAYGGDQSDSTRAHRPEVCYPAQGFQITEDHDGRVDLRSGAVDARRLVARLGGRNEPITYWVVVGDRVALSGTDQKFAQLRYSLRGVIPDGMLVRVSTIDQDTPRAYAVQSRFLADLAGSVPPAARARIFGAHLADVRHGDS